MIITSNINLSKLNLILPYRFPAMEIGWEAQVFNVSKVSTADQCVQWGRWGIRKRVLSNAEINQTGRLETGSFECEREFRLTQ